MFGSFFLSRVFIGLKCNLFKLSRIKFHPLPEYFYRTLASCSLSTFLQDFNTSVNQSYGKKHDFMHILFLEVVYECVGVSYTMMFLVIEAKLKEYLFCHLYCMKRTFGILKTTY